MSPVRPDRLDRVAAEELAGELLTRAVAVADADGGAKLAAEALGEAVGYTGKSAEKHWREHCAGTRPLTFPKLLQLLDNRPRVGRALVGVLAAWLAKRHGVGSAPVLAALQVLVSEALALATEGYEVARDHHVDAGEETRMLARAERMERAIVQFRAACAPGRRGAGAAS